MMMTGCFRLKVPKLWAEVSQIASKENQGATGCLQFSRETQQYWTPLELLVHVPS